MTDKNISPIVGIFNLAKPSRPEDTGLMGRFMIITVEGGLAPSYSTNEITKPLTQDCGFSQHLEVMHSEFIRLIFL